MTRSTLFLFATLGASACADSNELLPESPESSQLEKRTTRDSYAYIQLHCSANGLPTSFSGYLGGYSSPYTFNGGYSGPFTFSLDGGPQLPASYIDLAKPGFYHVFTIDSDGDTTTTTDDVQLLDYEVITFTSNGDNEPELAFVLDDVGC